MPKNFSDFTDITLAFGDETEEFNFGFTANATFELEKNALFEDGFFLIFRRSQYAAEIELAIAKIFKLLMGYGPEMELVVRDNQFFVASRKIRNFKTGCSFFKNTSDYHRYDGLAAMFILCYFLCESDMQSDNYGIQENEETLSRFFKIDNPEALELDMLNAELTKEALKRIPYIYEKFYFGVCEESLPRVIVESERFQTEKLAMIQLIAKTSFTMLEEILRNTITCDYYSHLIVLHQKILNLYSHKPAKQAKINLEFAKIDPQNCSIETLITRLKHRHEKWQQLALEVNFEQDYSFASTEEYYKEANKFHGDENSDSESDSCSSISTKENDSLFVFSP